MLTWIKRLVTPPVFAGDEDKTRAARLLHIILLTLLARAVFIHLITWFEPPRRSFFWPSILLFLAMMFLMRRGVVRLASAITVLGFWLSLTAVAANSGGIHSTGFRNYILPALIAGLLLGRVAAIATAGLSILAGLMMWTAQINGLLSAPPGATASGELLITHSISLLMAAVLVTLATRSIEEALARARREIVERRQAEAAARESESRWHAVFDNAGIGIALVNAEGHPVHSNPALQRMLNYSEEELRRESFVEFSHPDDAAKDVALFQELAEGKRGNYQIEKRYLRKDGEVRWGNLTVSAMRERNGHGQLMIGMVEDITERKQVEDALRLSEERFAKMFHASPESASVYRHRDGVLLEVNQHWTAAFGYTREEAIGRTASELNLVTPEYRQRLRQILDAQGSIHELEMEIKNRQGETRHVILSAEQIVIQGELCNIFFHRDITERQRAEAALRESEEVFRTLAETISSGIFIHQNMQYVYVNSTAERLTGYTRHELLKMNLLELIHPDLHEMVKARVAARERGEWVPSSTEDKIVTKSGEIRWMEVTAGSITFRGQPATLVTTFDITERKRAEEALRRNEELFRAIVEDQTEMIVRWKPDGTRTFVNQAYCRVFGGSAEEFIGSSFFPLITEEYQAIVRQKIRSLTPSHPVATHIHESITPTGETCWQEWTDRGIFDTTGQLVELQSTGRDISERKRAEEALRASEERFSKAFNLSPLRMGIVRIKDGAVLDVNDCWVREMGFTREEVIGHPIFDLKLWIGEESSRIRQFVQDGQPIRNMELQAHTKAGNKRITLTSAEVIELSGEACLLWAANDITERKRAEEALRESEELFRTSFENATAGVCLVGTDGKFLSVNHTLCEMLGYSKHELERLSFNDITLDEDKPIGDVVVAQALAGSARRAHFEKRYVHRDGHIIWVYVSTALIYPPADKPRYFISYIQDITERKQAETERLSLMHDLGERVKELTALHRTARLLQAERPFDRKLLSELAAWLPPAWQYPEVCEARITYADLEVTTPGWRETPWRQTARFTTSDGQSGIIEVAYLEARPSSAEGPFLAEERHLIQSLADMLAAHLERKRAETALRESEERFRQIAEHIQDVIWMDDSQYQRIIYVNPAYNAIWGRQRENLYRRFGSFAEAAHPEDRERVSRMIEDRAHGIHRLEEYRIIQPDGTVRWIQDRSFPIRDSAGQVYRVAGIAEDITERKQTEEQLRATSEQLRALMVSLRSAREQEGIRIAREIHDELGSALTSLRWDLEEIDKALSEATGQATTSALRKKIGDMFGLIDATIHVVRRISSELRPSILDDLGLAAAVEWQAQQFQARTSITCHCDCSIENLDLDQERSTAVFRIFQEALTNVLRHAQATRIEVTMEEARTDLVLKIRDNGRGITESEKSGSRSLGLLGMRERAHLIGARIEISGIQGQGTTVTLQVPNSISQSAVIAV